MNREDYGTDFFLLDTCVVSFLFKGDIRANRFRPYIERGSCVVSFMTIAELKRWTMVANWGPRRIQELGSLLGRFGRFEEVDEKLCECWEYITHYRQPVKGQSDKAISCADAWIAASAMALGIPLLTNNRSHFEGIEGLVVPDPA